MASFRAVRRAFCTAAEATPSPAPAPAPVGRWERLKSKVGVWCRSLLSDYKEACKEIVVGARERPLKASVYMGLLGGAYACFTTIPDQTSFQAALLDRSNRLGLLSPWIRNAGSDLHVQNLVKLENHGCLRHISLGLFSLVYRADYDPDSALYEARCSNLSMPWRELPERVLDVGFVGRWWILEKKMQDFDVNEAEYKHLPAHMQATAPPGVQEVERNERLHRESWLPLPVPEDEMRDTGDVKAGDIKDKTVDDEGAEVVDPEVVETVNAHVDTAVVETVNAHVDTAVVETVNAHVDTAVVETVNAHVDTAVVETVNAHVDTAVVETVNAQVDTAVVETVNAQVDTAVVETVNAQVDAAVVETVNAHVDTAVVETVDAQVDTAVVETVNTHVDTAVVETVNAQVDAAVIETVNPHMDPAVVETTLTEVVETVEPLVDTAVMETVSAHVDKEVLETVDTHVDPALVETVDVEVAEAVNTNIALKVDGHEGETVDRQGDNVDEEEILQKKRSAEE